MKRSDITDIFPEATKEQIDKIMDLNGADINAEKKGADDLRGQLKTATDKITAFEEKAKTAITPEELKKAIERAENAETELSALKMANSLREMRDAVAKETGVPASLLTAETEELCKAQAQSILAFAKPNGYPSLKDGGEIHAGGMTATRDKFADWAKDNL